MAEYVHDPTQGTGLALGVPGTLVRHHGAPGPGGTRFVQETDGAQLDLLAGVADRTIAGVRNGYLRSSDIADPVAFARALEDRFEAIRIGVLGSQIEPAHLRAEAGARAADSCGQPRTRIRRG